MVTYAKKLGWIQKEKSESLDLVLWDPAHCTFSRSLPKWNPDPMRNEPERLVWILKKIKNDLFPWLIGFDVPSRM